MSTGNKTWQMPIKVCGCYYILNYSYQLSDDVEVSCVGNRTHAMSCSVSLD